MPTSLHLYESPYVPFAMLNGATGVLDLSEPHLLMSVFYADVGVMGALVWDRERWVVAVFDLSPAGLYRLRAKARQVTLDQAFAIYTEHHKPAPAELLACMRDQAGTTNSSATATAPDNLERVEPPPEEDAGTGPGRVDRNDEGSFDRSV